MVRTLIETRGLYGNFYDSNSSFLSIQIIVEDFEGKKFQRRFSI